MKKSLIVLTSVLMFTGCAQVQENVRRNFTPSADLAVEDCQKMGFKKGTNSFQQCVITTSVNIRNTRAEAAAASEAARRAATPKTIQCHRTGSYVNCTEF